MAFLFGPLLPVIFLYGLLGMFILYITLRLRIAYSDRRIPNYSSDTNEIFFKALGSGPPIAFILVSAWVYSNQQVFENTVLPNKSHSVYNSPSGHSLG